MTSLLPSCCQRTARPVRRDLDCEEHAEDVGPLEAAGCVEKEEREVQDWLYVGEGNGTYAQTPEYDYVGEGYGSYLPQKIITYHHWKFRKGFLSFLYLLATATAFAVIICLAIFMKRHADEASHGHDSAASTLVPQDEPLGTGRLPIFNCDDQVGMNDLKQEYCCRELGKFCSVAQEPSVATPSSSHAAAVSAALSAGTLAAAAAEPSGAQLATSK